MKKQICIKDLDGTPWIISSKKKQKKLLFNPNIALEINNLPKNPDMKNFETYLMSKVGKTLYKNFFENFTKKFWNINPSKLSSEWALIRKLGSSINEKKMFFNKKWCSYPKKDWNQDWGV